MANFFGSVFQSKEERERDYQNYFNKIFPFGEPQKQKIQQILNELVNESKVNSLMMHYVLIKEAMLDSEAKDYGAIAAKVEKKKYVKLTSELKDCIRILIEKDLIIDEDLAYPTVEEIKSMVSKNQSSNKKEQS